jgi:hypothetical protein
VRRRVLYGQECSGGAGLLLLFGPERWRLGAATSVIRYRLIDLVDLDDYQTFRTDQKHDMRLKL